MRRLCQHLLVLVLCLSLAGCGPAPRLDRPPGHRPAELVYYTIGYEDKDLKLVEDALNRLLLERYGFTVSYHKIGWNDYLNQLNGLINTSQQFDIAFTWGEHYLQKADNGVFMNLAPYLSSDRGQDLYEAVDPLFWKGVSVGEGIYGVPTNKELATPMQFLFSRELVEKYNFDLSGPMTLETLEPMLQVISRNEPDCIPLFFDSDPIALMEMVGYEYLTANLSPLVIRTDDPTGTIVNLYETPEARRMLRLLHRYYQAGFINADAALRTGLSRFEDEKVFCRLSSSGPDSSQSFSIDYGYPIIAVQASPALITNASTQGGIMAVNAKTRYPREAQLFLCAVNTDPDVRNLLNFGLEGIHYRMNEDGQAQLLSTDYRGVPYAQGNWFILHTMEGEPADKWEQYREFNRNARSSRLLGFEPNFHSCQEVSQSVSRITQQYQAALMTGSVNPDLYLPRLNRALEDAGLQDLIDTLQPQVDAWMERNKQP